MKLLPIALFILNLLLFVFAAPANQSIDSLELELNGANGIKRVNILCDLCWEYRFVSSDIALVYGYQARDLAKALSYNKGLAQAYNDLGIIYIDQADYTTALDYFENSLSIRLDLNDSLGVAALYNKMGIVYQKQGKLKEAFEQATQALTIYESLKSDLWIGYCLNNIAIISYNLGNLETSLEYHSKALTYRKRMNDRYGEAGSYSNIANVWLSKGDTLTAIDNYYKALKITREIQNDESTAVTLANLGAVYLSMGANEQALILLDESYEIRSRLGDQKAIASSLLKMGAAKLNQKKLTEAKSYLYEALKIARSIGVIEEEMQAYQEITRWHTQARQMDSALFYMELYAKQRDSVYAKRLSQQIVDAQTKYDTERNRQELALVKRENQLTAISLKQRKTEILLLVVLIVGLLLSGLFFFSRRKQKQKIALDAAIIKHNEEQIKAVLEAQEEERRRIARELHDGVGQSLSGAKLKCELIADQLTSDQSGNDIGKMKQILDDAANEVRSISHQMMPKELEQFGILAAVESVLSTSLDSQSIAFTLDHHLMDSRFSNEIELGVYRVCQELLCNVIKHAQASEINIQLLKRREWLVFVLEDNGIGFDYKAHVGSGIGLMNIESRVRALNGVLDYQSDLGEGTLVTIRIPYT